MKYLFSALLVLISAHCAKGQDKQRSPRAVTTAKGDKIEFTSPIPDSVYVLNPTTGKEVLRTFDKVAERPHKLNGKELVHDLVAYPSLGKAKQDINKLVDDGLKEAFNSLDSGSYTYKISSVVIDEKGYVAYYFTEGIKDAGIKDFLTRAPQRHTIPAEQETRAYKAIIKVMANLKTEPLIIDGKAMPFTIDLGSTFLKG